MSYCQRGDEHVYLDRSGVCNLVWLIILLLCLSLYHVGMLIQRLKKCWIENPSLTCVKTIQNSVYGIILDCFNMREIGLDF